MCAHMQFTPFIPKETVIQETAKSMRTIAEEEYSSKSSLIPRDEQIEQKNLSKNKSMIL